MNYDARNNELKKKAKLQFVFLTNCNFAFRMTLRLKSDYFYKKINWVATVKKDKIGLL